MNSYFEGFIRDYSKNFKISQQRYENQSDPSYETEEDCELNIVVDETSTHRAIKDHKCGQIKKGDKYSKQYKRGYYTDSNGKVFGNFVNISKRKIGDI